MFASSFAMPTYQIYTHLHCPVWVRVELASVFALRFPGVTNKTLKSGCLLAPPHCAGRGVLVGTQMGKGLGAAKGHQ